MPNYPVSVDSLANPTATTKRNDPGFELHAVISTLNDIAEAVETKLGTGASVPAASTLLAGTGAGASAFSASPVVSGLNVGATSGAGAGQIKATGQVNVALPWGLAPANSGLLVTPTGALSSGTWHAIRLTSPDTTGYMIVGLVSNGSLIQQGVIEMVQAVPLVFRTANATRLVLTEFGHLQPAATNTYDLGASGTGWRDVWCVRGSFNGSARALKRDVAPLEPEAALAAVAETEIVTFRYRPTDERDAGAERLHVGYVADEAPELLSPDRENVAPQTTASVALAAIQAVMSRLEALDARLARLEAGAAGG